MHQLKEADMVSAKLDLIMKKLEARDTMKKELMHISDSRMTCEECGDVGHSGVNCLEFQEDANYINNNNNYRPQQNQWNQQQRPNYQPNYYTQLAEMKWIDYSLSDKKGDPGRPVIPISIGCHVFPEAVCDFGASVNIMPKVIYEKILGNPLLYTNMHLQLADQSICYPEGVLEEVIVRVGQSYVPVDFVVVET
jgi:hypothetical protein